MITGIDLGIVAAYILIVFVIASVFSVGHGVESFLVNKRATKLFFLVTSIVSTNVGAGYFLSVAAEAYDTGISFGITMIVIATVTTLTIAAFAKKMKTLADAGNVHTIPELLTQRYKSPLVGLIASIITVAGYVFVTALQFVGIGAVGVVVAGVDFNRILLFAGIATVIYTAIGGIRSDLIADALSFVIIAVILAVIVPLIVNSAHVDFSALPASHLNVLAFGGVSFFLLSILLAAVSAFMFMELWQRVFAAESIQTARRAFLISALIQPLFIGAGIFLGLVASLLYHDIDKSMAIFKVMANFLPPGLVGLGIAAVLAILMTTVNSLVVVGGSTLFTDILKPRLGNITERSQLRWVRLLTVIFGFFSLGMAFVLPDLVRLLLMGAFIMMPMCPAIIWSLFERKPRPGAVVTSMITGVAVTLVLLPRLPQTAFGPGFLVSAAVLIIDYFVSYSRPIVKGG